MKHSYPLLLLLLLLPGPLAVAQSAGMHTAPGKPLRVQRGLPGPYAPAPPPVIPMRWWREPDSAKRATQ